MNPRLSPLFLSFSAGVWFRTDVRISWYLPLLLPFFILRLGWVLGSTLFLISFVSVVIHEFAHVAACRYQGGDADEILIWPLGGLAFCVSRSAWASIYTSAAGPFSNLLICAAVFYPAWRAVPGWDLFNPLVLPISEEAFRANVPAGLAVLTFSWNFLLLLLNLVPAMPLDGGSIVRGLLTLRMPSRQARDISLRVGFVCGILLAILGMLAKQIDAVAIGFFLLAYAQHEYFAGELQRLLREVGYSDEYEPEEQYDYQDSEEPVRKLSFWERWKRRRQDEARRKESAAIAEAETQLDALLAKVHEKGMEALSESEKRMLRLASERLRKRVE